MSRAWFVAAACLLSAPVGARAQEPLESNGEYRIEPIPLPDGLVLEVGGLAFLPDGRLAACTRRGEVWIFEGVLGDPAKITSKRFATGLHEPLGIAWRDGALETVQRGELTRLIDLDRDGICDRYETRCDKWGVTGNYHEYSFGPKFDREGNAWLTLNLGWVDMGRSLAPWRGWAGKVTPKGEFVPVCPGLRSPSGLGFNSEGDAFYTDNQGDWNAVCSLRHLRPGRFMGHPEGLKWCREKGSTLEAPEDIPDGVSFEEASRRIPSLQLPAVWFPYKRMGQAASDVVLDDRRGKFGPFAGQLFVGDQTTSEVMRVFLEKVGGEYQGACFPFVRGFESGVLRMAFAEDSSMIVGMTNRGWGSLGTKEYGLARVRWSGTVPFEVLELRATPDGFDLQFTEPVDPATAGDPASYKMFAFTYEYHSRYGCDELEQQALTVRAAEVSPTGNRVRLRIDSLKPFFVHELRLGGVRSRNGAPLAHPLAFYTLNRVPER